MKSGFGGSLATVALLVFFLLATGTALAQEDGRTVYDTSCSACHQPGGIGIPGSFPPLAGNTNAADTAYVEAAIRDGLSGPIEGPNGSYDGEMPALSQLSDAEIEAVVAYVATLADAAPSTTVTTTGESVVADARRGENLFLGSTTLANGGPACAACHAAGGNGHLGGSGLGPDLTGAVDRYGGEQGFAAVMANPPFPTMQPLFAGRALDAGEIADLTAFLAGLEAESRGEIDGLWLLGLGGLGALLIITVTVFRRPRAPYVQKLRSRT